MIEPSLKVFGILSIILGMFLVELHVNTAVGAVEKTSSKKKCSKLEIIIKVLEW